MKGMDERSSGSSRRSRAASGSPATGTTTSTASPRPRSSAGSSVPQGRTSSRTPRTGSWRGTASTRRRFASSPRTVLGSSSRSTAASRASRRCARRPARPRHGGGRSSHRPGRAARRARDPEPAPARLRLSVEGARRRRRHVRARDGAPAEGSASAVVSATRPEPNLKDALDLVALGTVADVVPLVGANRSSSAGDPDDRDEPAPGLRALKRRAGSPRAARSPPARSASAAPRINAAGRLDDAGRGVRLLLADDDGTARARWRRSSIARTLRGRRSSGASWTRRWRTRARGSRRARAGSCSRATGGTRGSIVASRIVERFHRPAVLIALEDGAGGSGRSIEAFHLYDALAACSGHSRFGGHRHAAGVTVERSRVEAFRMAFEAGAATHLAEDDLAALPDRRLARSGRERARRGGPRAAGAVRAGYPEPVFALRAPPAPAPSGRGTRTSLDARARHRRDRVRWGTGSPVRGRSRRRSRWRSTRGTVRAGCSSSSATSARPPRRGGGPPRRLTAGYATPQLASRSVKRVPSFASSFTWIRSACFEARATPAGAEEVAAPLVFELLRVRLDDGLPADGIHRNTAVVRPHGLLLDGRRFCNGEGHTYARRHARIPGTTRPSGRNCRRVPENRHARDRPTGERPGAARQALAPGAWLRERLTSKVPRC